MNKRDIDAAMPLHRFVSALLHRLCGDNPVAVRKERRAFFTLQVRKYLGAVHVDTLLQTPDNYGELVQNSYAYADGVEPDCREEVCTSMVLKNMENVWKHRVKEPSPVMDYENIADALAFTLDGFDAVWYADLNGYVLVCHKTGEEVCFLDRVQAAVVLNPYKRGDWSMPLNADFLAALTTAAYRLETLRKHTMNQLGKDKNV